MLCCGRTDIGRRRKVNQDSFMCDDLGNGITLAVVCDGMGGPAGGGIASSLACGSFSEHMGDFAQGFTAGEKLSRTDERRIIGEITSAVDAANTAVFSRAGENDSLKGMGTTLVATVYCRGVLFTVNIGDSRMYLLQNGAISKVTHDHSYVQYLVDMGKMTQEEAERSMNKNIITRAVGTDRKVEADIFVTRLEKNTPWVAVLCSDGLTNHVTPAEIAAAVKNAADLESDRALGRVAEELIQLANENGGTDNITAAIMAG